MKISSLQKARYEYSPKLPGMLRNGISNICVKEGEETSSVADQEKSKRCSLTLMGKRKSLLHKGKILQLRRNRLSALFFPVVRRRADIMLYADFMMR